MRPLADLLSADSALPLVRSWIAGATRSVEILPVDRPRSEAVLLALQVTTRSPMGAVALETGGLLIDRWLRVLGGGGPRMDGDLARWNGLGERPLIPARSGSLLVAHDAIGGFFALNGGGLRGDKGEVFYFAPDSLSWEGIDMGYSDWLEAMMSGDLQNFYAENRWDGWQKEVEALSPDDGIAVYPPLWAAESRPIEKTSRKVVPMLELWHSQWDMQKQMDERLRRDDAGQDD
jgi:hypothetical protein